jgi:ABC-type phosphate/phosphonate transport system ATPase subunit
LEDEANQSDPFNPVHHFVGIAVVVIGVSGAGKTALMSKVASEMYTRREGKSKVVIRFCGTSPRSKNARNVVMSICRQMEFLFHVQETKPSSLENLSYGELVDYFQALVHKHPVLLFIDSLDQLTDENQGRSQISFL